MSTEATGDRRGLRGIRLAGGEVLRLATPDVRTSEDAFDVLTPAGLAVPARTLKPPSRVEIRLPGGGTIRVTLAAGHRLHVVGPRGTAFFGLGEAGRGLDRAGGRFRLWNTDAWGYTRDTDPLYVSIPFTTAVTPGGEAFGLFLRNTHELTFRFRAAGTGFAVSAAGGGLDLFVLPGPQPEDVLRAYADITGRPPLPPLWALGYHQSRYSYAPERRVRAIARGFRRRRIPCDAIHLDIDCMDGFRVFTFDPAGFPDPAGLLAWLATRGFRAVPIVDPGVKVDPGWSVYDAGLEAGAYVRDRTGAIFEADVWPGRCAFPDFVSEAGRRFWIEAHRPFVALGFQGIWNDMNEPAVFREGERPDRTFDRDVRHRGPGGEALLHGAVHNVYGMAMTRASREALAAHRPDSRPFVLTRATFAGGQKFAAVWTGDNTSSFASFAHAIPQLLNLSVSGMAFAGCDAGGFSGNPTPELFARWIAAAAFFPFFRAHSEKGTADQEPWSFGRRVTRIARRAIRLRYALLPFIASLMDEASRTGLPPLRPLWFHDPSDAALRREETQFLLGRDLLVAPVIDPGATSRDVTLPRGAWIDLFTGAVHRGPGRIRVAAPLHRIPVLVRSPAVIPLARPRSCTPPGPFPELRLVVFGTRDSGGVTARIGGLPGREASPLVVDVRTVADRGLEVRVDPRDIGGATRLHLAWRGLDLAPPRRTLGRRLDPRLRDPDLGLWPEPFDSSGTRFIPFRGTVEGPGQGS